MKTSAARRPHLVDENRTSHSCPVPIDMAQHFKDICLLRSFVVAMSMNLVLQGHDAADGIDLDGLLWFAQQADDAAARATTIGSWLEDQTDAIAKL
jgi:hypothetical protein